MNLRILTHVYFILTVYFYLTQFIVGIHRHVTRVIIMTTFIVVNDKTSVN